MDKSKQHDRAGHPGVIPGEKQLRRNVALSQRLADIATGIGDGNLSEGIRRALIAYTDGPDQQPEQQPPETRLTARRY